MGSLHPYSTKKGFATSIKYCTTSLILQLILQTNIYRNNIGVSGFTSQSYKHSSLPSEPLGRKVDTSFTRNYHSSFRHAAQLTTQLNAKKRKNQRDIDTFNNWYDKVDNDATPDDVFWEEMERQKLLTNTNTNSIADSVTNGDEFNIVSSLGQVASTSAGRGSKVGKREEIIEQKNVESVLNSYGYAMVDDNFLGDQEFLMYDDGEDVDFDMDDIDLEEENRLLDEQFEEMKKDVNGKRSKSKPLMVSSVMEPWDTYGQNDDDDDIIKISDSDSEYLLDSDQNDTDDIAEEMEYIQSLSTIKIHSPRLESAKNSPRAKDYFAQPPNTREGYDRTWVSAIEEPCLNNLHGVFRNYGIQFLENFGDWIDMVEDDKKRSIEDIASYKARKVFEITGLPCIASRTSFEVEPVAPNGSGGSNGDEFDRGMIASKLGRGNQRILSGYRFNDVGDHIDYLVDALLPSSDPCRKTRFRTVICFYDGEMEIFDYGECDVDIYYANSLRTFIPMSTALNEMCKTLQLSFGLEYQKWLKQQMHEIFNKGAGKASMKLRDRVLKEGRVLPNDIIDVSAFMDSMVDVLLMDECGDELAKRFLEAKPTKILTIATTGLVIAIPMAKYLQVPVVYARKERNVVMSNTYQAAFSSKTVGKNRELLVSKSHLSSDDRVLIVDDFLSSGASQEALLRIISESGATPVGVGVLLEKVFDSGRQFLSGYDIPVESMVRVASVQDQMIQLVEEVGYGK